MIKAFRSDQTVGTVASSTSETEIGEVEIPANEVETGVLVLATGEINARSGSGNNGTVKLYGGTNGTATSNTEFKSLVKGVPDGGIGTSWAIVYWVTGLTWSSLNYINITGKNSDNNANAKVICESIVCVAV